jgi:hypothetical protein
MKLNWFSPLPPAKTKIADYTKRLLPSLSKNVDVILWTEQESWDVELEAFAQIYHYHPHTIPWDTINEGDMNIYHMDDNPNFQRSIGEISRQCPGLVVLHDMNIDHFFAAIYCNIHRNLTTLAMLNGAGIIVHNQRYYNLLQEDKTRFTGYIPLPNFLDISEDGWKIAPSEKDVLEQSLQLENYTKTMMDFAEITKRYRRYALTNQLIDKAVKEVSLLGDIQSLNTSFETVTKAIHFLLS